MAELVVWTIKRLSLLLLMALLAGLLLPALAALLAALGVGCLPLFACSRNLNVKCPLILRDPVFFRPS